MKDDQGNSRGFGFVCFRNPHSAEAAVGAMNDKEINGIKLYVGRAQKKAERQEFLRQEHEKQQIGRLSQDGVFVKNLDATIDDVGLKEIFSRYGNVTSAKVMLDGDGMSKGFGFVCFSTPEEAREAVKLNGTHVGSKTLHVSLVKCSLDSDKMFLSKQQQRVDYRPNFVNIFPALPGAYAQVPANTLHLFYPANATMSSHPRLSHSVAGSQFQLGYPRIVPVSPHIGGAMPAAMFPSHFTAPYNPISLAFGGTVGGQQLMPNPLTTVMPGPATGMAGGQRYLLQHPYMLSQTPCAGESAPHQATNPTPANIMPGPNAQPSEQFQETYATAYPAPAEETPGAEQHTAASPSSAQHDDSANDGAGVSDEDKRSLIN
nr:polyadenylate binding protein [Hymenolepis microstoma]